MSSIEAAASDTLTSTALSIIASMDALSILYDGNAAFAKEMLLKSTKKAPAKKKLCFILLLILSLSCFLLTPQKYFFFSINNLF